MKTLLTLLAVAGLLSGVAVAEEKHWEKATIVSQSLQRMVGPSGGRPATYDVLIIDLGDQTYTLIRWSGKHTQMADLPTQYVQVYRTWGAVPLARATKGSNLAPVLLLGAPGLLFAGPSPSFIKVLDNRSKHMLYEVLAVGESEKLKKEAPLPPGMTAKTPEAQNPPSDSVLAPLGNSLNVLSGEKRTVDPQSQNVVAQFGLEVAEQGGVEIVKVFPDSAAALAGLRVGDVINSVDGNRVKGVKDFTAALVNHPSEAKIRIGYMFQSNTGWIQGTQREFFWSMPAGLGNR